MYVCMYVIFCIYYIKTNEIPGELSREHMISSYVQRTPLLWLHNTSRFSQQKRTVKVKWFGTIAKKSTNLYVTQGKDHVTFEEWLS